MDCVKTSLSLYIYIDIVYSVYWTSKGPQPITRRRRIKEKPGPPISQEHPSLSDAAAEPPPLSGSTDKEPQQFLAVASSRQRQSAGGDPDPPLTPAGSRHPAQPIPPSSTAPASSAAASSARRERGRVSHPAAGAGSPPGPLRAPPRPHRALVGVHALLALQTCRQLLVGAVGDLLHQLQALLHLRMQRSPSPGYPAWSRTRRPGTEGTSSVSIKAILIAAAADATAAMPNPFPGQGCFKWEKVSPGWCCPISPPRAKLGPHPAQPQSPRVPGRGQEVSVPSRALPQTDPATAPTQSCKLPYLPPYRLN